ncbi:acyltransferase [Luteimonas sp. MC1825]|uniref:acyltransferase family protein n=1 Tax=Luteimonas sp. MC1825 TaxID=2761107 RepID=UPI001611F2A0|nr:acyltransferase [Luteimonas sp. MC1825]MBB6598751.1 acyltransferase [Luteimonas sp. MC1825]QOC88914.1 acyltransferase [Luteimonas sp. MC1825]
MSHGRVNEIDLLRFAAALAVVFFHYAFRGIAADDLALMGYPALAPAARYGFLGVQLFFMISGFVILMTAARGSLRAFVVSRVVRLYPAFWACCTLTFLAILAIGGTRFSATFGQYLANMTMMSEFIGVESIDGVYWSLFVEIRFYAMVALLLVLGRIRQAPAFMVGWLLVALALTLVPVDGPRRWLAVDSAAYFVAGAACYLVWSDGLSRGRVAMLLASWALAVYQAIRWVPRFDAHYRTTLDLAVVAAIITAFFVVMVLVSLRLTGAFGARRWVALGALTYPLYLLHQNIGFMLFNIAWPANGHVVFWGTLALVLVASHAVHVLAERRQAPRLKAWAEAAWDGGARRAGRLRARALAKHPAAP